MRETAGMFRWLGTRNGGFFRYEVVVGGIKNGRCVPSVVGEGSSISFRRWSPAKPRRSHLGLAGRARCQKHKMAEEPRVNAGPTGGGAHTSQGRGGFGRERSDVLWGLSLVRVRQGRILSPECMKF